MTPDMFWGCAGIGLALSPLSVVWFAVKMSGLEAAYNGGILTEKNVGRWIAWFMAALPLSIVLPAAAGLAGVAAIAAAEALSARELLKWRRKWDGARKQENQ